MLVKIKVINWIDIEALEAEVLFETKDRSFWAFCHPCGFILGEITEASISFIEEEISEAVFWGENSEEKKEIIPSLDENWRYYCYGQIQSLRPMVVDCGAITFNHSDRINDDKVIGTYVYFVISRLDLGK